jgi:hypothetical protein
MFYENVCVCVCVFVYDALLSICVCVCRCVCMCVCMCVCLCVWCVRVYDACLIWQKTTRRLSVLHTPLTRLILASWQTQALRECVTECAALFSSRAQNLRNVYIASLYCLPAYCMPAVPGLEKDKFVDAALPALFGAYSKRRQCQRMHVLILG